MIYINDIPVQPTIFPDKTSQVWKLHSDLLLNYDEVSIKWVFNNEGEFLVLAQLKTLLDRYNVKANLDIKYLPYARQDKSVGNERTFALETFAKLLNSLNFVTVRASDAHSFVATQLINRFYSYLPHDQVHRAFKETRSTDVCYPDNGAVNKYRNEYRLPYCYGQKVREQSSGLIISYKLLSEGLNLKHDTWNRRVLIVDDICDGGATFVLLAKELYKIGVKEVNLFVTHGLFTKGLEPLKAAGIKRFFTQDGEVTECL